MSTGPLVIHHGSPRWWLSPDIWVTKPGGSNAPPGVGNPMAGTVYDVQVRVLNESSSVVSDWTLFVCWAIPTIGSISSVGSSVATTATSRASASGQASQISPRQSVRTSASPPPTRTRYS